MSLQNAQRIFTSGYFRHGLVFFNSSVASQAELVEESRSLAKKFKSKVVCLCARACVVLMCARVCHQC